VGNDAEDELRVVEGGKQRNGRTVGVTHDNGRTANVTDDGCKVCDVVGDGALPIWSGAL